MSSFLYRLKAAIEHVPEPVGRYLALVPYSLRFGGAYNRSQRQIGAFAAVSLDEKEAYVLERLQHIVRHAHANTEFYREMYRRHGFHPDDLQSLDDFARVPIVTKSDFQAWPLEERSVEERGRLMWNTGGTTGNPLGFYLDANAFAREYAYIHHLWKQLEYQRTDIKMTFRGRNVGQQSYTYNAVHNEYLVNGYRDYGEMADEIRELVERKPIKYLHGYPSAVYEFAQYCLRSGEDIAAVLRETLHGVLLGSEYPAPIYRDVIDQAFGAPSLSWYGHSEMVVLASERGTPFKYHPLQTYGYCEAVPDGNGEFRLIGTAYHNTASPFIRYDTGDRIKDVKVEGRLVRSFRIASGRVGDFIVDRKGHHVSLTALIFGRHHALFEHAQFVQVRQKEPGRATIIVTKPSPDHIKTDVEWERLFDQSNVDIDFSFQVREEPVRTKQGKVKLLV